MILYRWFFLTAIGLLAQACQAVPLLAASTETATPGGRVPPSQMIQSIVDMLDSADKEGLQQCLAAGRQPAKPREHFFMAVELPRLARNETLYFVRPALQPYCDAFYGAHLFRYWLVAEKTQPEKSYVVRRAGAADDVRLLASASNGSYDIEETHCTAVGCGTVLMKFDRKRYQPRGCLETTSGKDGKDVEKIVECKRD